MPKPELTILLQTAIRFFELSTITVENIERAYLQKSADFSIDSFLQKERVRIEKKIKREHPTSSITEIASLVQSYVDSIDVEEMTAILSIELEKIKDMYQLILNYFKPLEILNLSFDAELTREIINKAFRKFAQKNMANHTDRGGDGTLFIEGEWAKTILLLRLEAENLDNDGTDLRLLSKEETPSFVLNCYGERDGYEQTVFQTKTGDMLLSFSTHSINYTRDISGNIFNLYILESKRITASANQSISSSIGIWLHHERLLALLELARSGDLTGIISCFESGEFQHKRSSMSSTALTKSVSIQGETAREINSKMTESVRGAAINGEEKPKKSLWGMSGFGLLRSTVAEQKQLASSAELLLLNNGK